MLLGKRNQQSYAVTNSSEFKDRSDLTGESWSKNWVAKTAESSGSVENKREVSGKSVADSRVRVVCAHQPFGTSLSLRDQEHLDACLAPQAW